MDPLVSNKRPIIIMGGAPSLPSDLADIGDIDALRISCNQHAVSHYPCDLITFVDYGIAGVRMDKVLARYDTPTLSPHTFSTYRRRLYGFMPINTGVYSAWVAASTGCDVILAGIEFYQSPGAAYFDDCGYGVRRSNRQVAYFDKCVAKLAQCGPGKLYAVSGPLLAHLPKWGA